MTDYDISPEVRVALKRAKFQTERGALMIAVAVLLPAAVQLGAIKYKHAFEQWFPSLAKRDWTLTWLELAIIGVPFLLAGIRGVVLGIRASFAAERAVAKQR